MKQWFTIRKTNANLAWYLLILLCLVIAFDLCESASAEGYTQAIPLQYDEAKGFHEGLAAVMIGEKWGFIDRAGNEVVPLKYDYAYDFHDGLAAVVIDEELGYIDRMGTEVVPPKYWSAYADTYDFHDGMARVMTDGKCGFIDRTGTEIIPLRYDYAYDFHDGLALVMLGPSDYPEIWDIVDGQKCGLIDKTGKEVVPVEYDKIGKFHEGLACVIKNGKLGFVDEIGAVVVPLIYESSLPSDMAWYQDIMPFFSEGVAAIWGGEEHNGQYGYIDREGRVVIPFAYDYAAPFSEGLAYVSTGASLWYETNKDGKFGYINKAGYVVVPLEYDCDYVGHGILFDWRFIDGFAQVSQKGTSLWDAKYGLVDREGKEVVPIRYHWLRRIDDRLSFAGYGEDYSGHGTWDSIGLIDSTGQELVAVDHYAWIGDFVEGYAWVRYGGEGGEWIGDEESRFGFINKAGQEIVPCIFEATGDFSEGLAPVMMNGKWGYIAIVE